MAPGDIQGFGMDDAGLWRMAIPAYLIVGAGDTATPPKENAEFAAKYIPHAQLDVLPGQVGHEIFDNECDQVGRDNYPHACIDALWCESGQAARVHRENRVEVLRCESERAETKAELKGMQNQVVSRERQRCLCYKENAGCRFSRIVIRHCSRCAAKTELCVTVISFEALVSFDSKVFTTYPRTIN